MNPTGAVPSLCHTTLGDRNFNVDVTPHGGSIEVRFGPDAYVGRPIGRGRNNDESDPVLTSRSQGPLPRSRVLSDDPN